MNRRTASAAAAAISAVSAFAAAAAQWPAGAGAALRRAAASSASWRMERTPAGAAGPLVSTGVVSCAVGTGIVWRALFPFESSVEMRLDGMAFEDEDGRTFKPASAIPRYASVVELVDALSEGDFSRVEALFSVSEAETGPGGGWSLVLSPRSGELRRVAGSARLEGGVAPERAVLEWADGSVADIRFEEAAVGE